MACSTGEACGFTETRSWARRCSNQSAVMIVTIDALDAWWPPTFGPLGLGRTRLAWCTIAVASQSTRCSISRSTSGGCTVAWDRGAVLVIALLLVPRFRQWQHWREVCTTIALLTEQNAQCRSRPERREAAQCAVRAWSTPPTRGC